MRKVIWKSRSSGLLYIYHYLLFIAVAIGLNYVNPLLSLLPIIGLACFFIDSKTMKYEVTEDEVFFSASFLDRESAEINLKDIVGFYLVDEPPWNLFSLGTLLLVTDLTSDQQPCIKCVKNPEKIARLIKKHAAQCGADISPTFT